MVKMADISGKDFTCREAVASVKINAKKEVVSAIKNSRLPKGDCLSLAQGAGILAAKNTSSIIPLCHQININCVDINFKFSRNFIEIISSVKADYSTGVEMEALVACSVAALTIYDMAKALQRDIKISDLHLKKKTGGKSGVFVSGKQKKARRA